MTVELWTDGECRAVKHLSAYTGVVVTRQLRVPLGDEFHELWSFFRSCSVASLTTTGRRPQLSVAKTVKSSDSKLRSVFPQTEA